MIVRRIQCWLWTGVVLIVVGMTVMVVEFNTMPDTELGTGDPPSTRDHAPVLIAMAFDLFGLVALARSWQLRFSVNRRTKTQRCIQCAYQLEGLPDKVCPECGMPQPVPMSAANTQQSA